MSDYRVTVLASINMVNTETKEVVDLVDDLGCDEVEAAEYIHLGCSGNDDIEAMLRDYAIEMIGYSWECFPADKEAGE
jgi:wyosine [tRNA(Phe)-imidazoG37] synthetase (radical SAM superfamily)